MVKCSDCSQFIRMNDYPGHDCFTTLMKALAENEEMLEKMENKYRSISGKDPYDDTKHFLQCY